MSINIQKDFINYFDMVQTSATSSSFYKDIQEHFNNGRIDAKTYVSLMSEFNKETLSQAIEAGKSMSLGAEELRIKKEESTATIALTVRRTEAIGEELFIKGADSASTHAVNTERIEGLKKEKALVVEKTKEILRHHGIEQADANIRLVESNKNVLLTEARKDLVVRQKSGFEDNLRIKRAEHSSSLYGMIESGGNEAPPDLVTFTLATLNNI